MNEDLKSLLREECNFKPSDEVMDMFLDSMTEVHIRPASRIIDYGRVNSDVYCLKKGIVRLFYVVESKEKAFGFALPGTVFLSPLSFYLNASAFIMAETCKSSATLLRMDRQTFNALIDRSGEFAMDAVTGSSPDMHLREEAVAYTRLCHGTLQGCAGEPA